MKAVNVTSGSVEFSISRGPGETPRKYNLAPGEVVELEDGYLVRHRAPSGIQQSVVEKLTNGTVVPETDPRAQPYLAAPADVAAPSAAKRGTR